MAARQQPGHVKPRRNRSWPRSWAEPQVGDGDHNRGDEELQPVADQRCDGTGRGRSMLAFRTIHKATIPFGVEFSTNSRPSPRRQRHDGNRATDLTLHGR